MGSYTEEVGALPLNTGTYNQSITAVVLISTLLPTTAQRKKKGGLLTMLMSIENQNARVTIDGSTPTTTNGVLFTPGTYTFRGEQELKAMQIISTVAGGIINVGWYVGDTA